MNAESAKLLTKILDDSTKLKDVEDKVEEIRDVMRKSGSDLGRGLLLLELIAALTIAVVAMRENKANG